MTERDGLCALEVRVTRHDRFCVLISDVAEHLNERYDKLAKLLYSVAEIQTDIKRDLVVSGT